MERILKCTGHGMDVTNHLGFLITSFREMCLSYLSQAMMKMCAFWKRRMGIRKKLGQKRVKISEIKLGNKTGIKITK